MRRIDRERSQDRENFGHEPVFQPKAVSRFEICRFGDANASLVQIAAQRDPSYLLVGHQLTGALIDRVELLRLSEPVLAQRFDAGEMLPFQPGDAHHIKFVEVVCRNRQEPYSLEQWMAVVLGLGEYSLVEGKPGKLAIYEACLGVEIDRLDLDRLGASAHDRSPDSAGKELFETESIPWTQMCHVYDSCGREQRGRPQMALKRNPCNLALRNRRPIRRWPGRKRT